MSWAASIMLWLPIEPSLAASAASAGQMCAPTLTQQIPDRPATAPVGSVVVKRIMDLSGQVRDAAVAVELRAGNIPAFLRHLKPVTFAGKLRDGKDIQVTICVTPDYLAVGTDNDFVRIPLGLPTAAEIADRFGFLLPTTKMVDAIYVQAQVQLRPSPMQAGDQMRSTDYLWRHSRTVDQQRAAVVGTPDRLVAGQKKDLVLSNRLRAFPGRIAIYGWHRENGVPIQPLSTVHGEKYADYSHGVRLVSATAFVNGAPQPLGELLQNPVLAHILSSEGPIAQPRLLAVALYEKLARAHLVAGLAPAAYH